MKVGQPFRVLSMLLCIIQTSASDVIQCTEERQSDGQFYFKMSRHLTKDAHDCETQWLVNGTVVGFSNAKESNCFMPVVNLTIDTATLKVCPEKLECLLICPSAYIHENTPCFCETTPLDTYSEVGPLTPNTGFSIAMWVLGVIIVIALIIVSIVLCRRNQGSEYTAGCTNV